MQMHAAKKFSGVLILVKFIDFKSQIKIYRQKLDQKIRLK